MKALLFISAALSLLLGIFIFAAAKGGIHEATGALFVVVSAVAFSGAGIINALQNVERELKRQRPPE